MPSATVDIDNRIVAVAARLGRFAAKLNRPVSSCPYTESDAEASALRRVWLANYLRGRPPAAGTVTYDDTTVTEAARDDEQNDTYNAAAAGLILAWPVLSEPITTALSAGAMGLSGGAGAGLAALAVPQAALDTVAAGLAARLEPVAAATAAATVADAAAQGATVGQVQPDTDRLAELAAVTTAMIAASLTATAVEAAITSPGGAGEAARTALAAAGTAPRGQVATRLRAALTGAEAEGRRAVFEAHPPHAIVAVERDDSSTCAVCKEADGRSYATVAEALRDYPGFGGNRACLGSPMRCRGHLRGVWTRPVAESDASGPVELVLVETGTFHLA